MRLWSLHPSYLDTKGLEEVWAEALLAQKALETGEYKKCPKCYGTGYLPDYEETEDDIIDKIICPKCKGMRKIKTPYWNHPQLDRFKILSYKEKYHFGHYLEAIFWEANARGYIFDCRKIIYPKGENINFQIFTAPLYKITVTKEQLEFEFNYLLEKLEKRDKQKMLENGRTLGINNIITGEWINKIKIHPIFKVIEGDVESWEK